MIRTIIVDDEEKSRKILTGMLKKNCPQVEVAAGADSVAAAKVLINKYNPDLIFLDIIMPVSDGFTLLEDLGDRNPEIIFITSYHQYAIKAIRFSALDYLLKPIHKEELQIAVNKVEKRIKERDARKLLNERITVFLENNSVVGMNKKIGLATQSGIFFVKIGDIVLCKAEGNYSVIFLATGRKEEIVARTLRDFEDLLSDYNFFRIHRSYLINLLQIVKYNRTDLSSAHHSDGGSVLLSNNMILPVSRDKRKQLLERIAKPF
ncbi:MAG: LytR/AlgR family response regulator transcription factor [Calditrichaceae bacterium]